jgi:hypothetical protein
MTAAALTAGASPTPAAHGALTTSPPPLSDGPHITSPNAVLKTTHAAQFPKKFNRDPGVISFSMASGKAAKSTRPRLFREHSHATAALPLMATAYVASMKGRSNWVDRTHIRSPAPDLSRGFGPSRQKSGTETRKQYQA